MTVWNLRGTEPQNTVTEPEDLRAEWLKVLPHHGRSDERLTWQDFSEGPGVVSWPSKEES